MADFQRRGLVKRDGKRYILKKPPQLAKIAGLRDIVGADHMLMGSDWPHTEGLVEPLSFVKDLESAGFSDDEIQKICHDNTAALIAPAG